MFFVSYILFLDPRHSSLSPSSRVFTVNRLLDFEDVQASRKKTEKEKEERGEKGGAGGGKREVKKTVILIMQIIPEKYLRAGQMLKVSVT
jgi:hypothetical protein